MGHTELDVKRLWVEKLQDDLEELESLGIDKNSRMYREGVIRTKKAKQELEYLERANECT
ncbi:hypothetical protein [Enterococcus sp. AZ196]|uniref:hypothetical protein n=1 Tax=Enterococcus sp. AZ196 TaxID=2774659 RepID=UPI003D274084